MVAQAVPHLETQNCSYIGSDLSLGPLHITGSLHSNTVSFQISLKCFMFLPMSKGNDSLPLKKFSVSASCVPMIEVVSPQIISRTRTPSSAFFLSSSPTVRLHRSSSVWLFSRRQSSILKNMLIHQHQVLTNRGAASSKT